MARFEEDGIRSKSEMNMKFYFQAHTGAFRQNRNKPTSPASVGQCVWVKKQRA